MLRAFFRFVIFSVGRYVSSCRLKPATMDAASLETMSPVRAPGR